jgi:hypothetical protein
MIDNTDSGAEQIGEPTATMTAPADAPKAMGATEAAQLLASLRRPAATQQTSPPTAHPRIKSGDDPAAAAPAQQSEPAVAGDDAAPAETQATGEDVELDPAAPAEADAQPSLEPPRSWSADARERWSKLDPDTQQYLLERDRTDSAAIRKAQNEAARKLEAVTAKEQVAEQVRQQYEQALPTLMVTLQAQQAGEFADVRTIADVERLAREDWPRYLQWDLSQKKLAAVQQEMASAQQRQQQSEAQKLAEFARREDALFVEKVPEMADPAKATALQKSAVAMLRDIGFDEAQLARAYNSQGEFSLRDHRVQMLVVDALRYREAQAKAKKLVQHAKPVPPVQRPGTAPARGQAQADTIQHLERRLAGAKGQSGLRVAAQLLAARRASAN